MNRPDSFFKKLGQLLTAFVLGIALLFTTACNNGDQLGARPNNPPVQLGGNNNPHSMGGDGYTNYKMSTDPKVKGNNSNLRSSLLPESVEMGQLIASNGIKSNAANDLIYPGANAPSSSHPDIGPKEESLRPEPFPSDRQRIVQRSNPNEKILEKIGEQFEEASEFIKDPVDRNAIYNNDRN